MKINEIHDACIKAGLPVTTIRENTSGIREIVLRKGSETRQAEVDAFVADLLANPPAPIVVGNTLDALIVLRYDPLNVSAEGILREHFEGLRGK